MTNLAKLDYAALDITGKNYLTWVLDTKIHLEARNLGDTIREENSLSSQDQGEVAKQNNELLLKNHHSQPIGSAPFLEVNVAFLEVNATSSGGNNHKRGRDHRRGRWNGKDKNHGVQFHNQVPRHNLGPSFKNGNRHKGKARMNNVPRNSNRACHRYGGNGHWVRTCRTPKHLVDLYQASLKEKGVQTNFLNQTKPMDIPDPVCDLSG
ncbi:uncharacterized protein [Pyrus communis]|uniref:uncharacterized protein n=1 Tax=Pyrus communis TaxID=23211 RepID=UPI0035C136E4